MDSRTDETARDGAETSALTRTGHPRLVFAATIVASSLSFIDGSVVNVGLPTIQESFASDAAGLQWVVNAYLLPLSALLMFGGTLGDRVGRRSVLLAGLLLFATASSVCASAPTLPILIAGRAFQGIGAALLMPNSLAILGETFTGATRARAIGTWAAVGAAMSGVGPPFGGWLIDSFGWRAIFTINLPLAAVAIVLAWRFIPARTAATGRPLDAIGTLSVTAALGLLTFGLIAGSGPAGWTENAVAAVGSGLGGFGGFLLWERQRGPRAMMPLALFGSRAFVGLTLLTLLLYGALGALVMLLPYGLMRAGGASAALSGAALLPLTAAMTLLSPLVGRLAGRHGARTLLTVGPAVVGIGCLMLLRVDAGSHYLTTLLPALVVIGMGLAGAVAPLTTAVLASVEADLTGTASGLNSAVARTGGLVATACLGSVLSAGGDALIRACHGTALAAAAACFAAALCARLLPSRGAVP